MQASDFSAKTKEINGRTVSVNPWPAMKAFTFKYYIGRYLSTSIKDVLASIGGGASFKDALSTNINMESLGQAVVDLFANVSEKEATDILLRVLTGARVDGVEIKGAGDIDSMFVADMPSLYKVVFFVLEVNYSSFLGEGGFGKLLAAKKEKTT